MSVGRRIKISRGEVGGAGQKDLFAKMVLDQDGYGKGEGRESRET